jgi:predicted transposase/invertase (TIGR01784 family)
MERARQEGISQGIRQNAVENARNLYANGVSINLIAKSLKMSEDEVRELARDIVPETQSVSLHAE